MQDYHLDILIDPKTPPASYGLAMTRLGEILGNLLSSNFVSENSKLYLACTAEDADYLAKGVLSSLEERFQNVSFACFWNESFSPFNIKDLKIAPIIKKYQEPSQGDIDTLIIVKSIIASGCVVRTNLTNLVDVIHPRRILVVSPVMHLHAESFLKKDFESSIYHKISFLYFAKDNEANTNGEIIPGIGGMVYNRLKISDKEGCIQYIPKIVRLRRAKYLAQCSS